MFFFLFLKFCCIVLPLFFVSFSLFFETPFFYFFVSFFNRCIDFSLSLSRCHSYTYAPTHARTHAHSLAYSLTHTRTHSHTYTRTHTETCDCPIGGAAPKADRQERLKSAEESPLKRKDQSSFNDAPSDKRTHRCPL